MDPNDHTKDVYPQITEVQHLDPIHVKDEVQTLKTRADLVDGKVSVLAEELRDRDGQQTSRHAEMVLRVGALETESKLEQERRAKPRQVPQPSLCRMVLYGYAGQQVPAVINKLHYIAADGESVNLIDTVDLFVLWPQEFSAFQPQKTDVRFSPEVLDGCWTWPKY